MMKRSLSAFALAVALSLGSLTAEAQPQVSFGNRSLTIRNAGRTTVLFSISKEYRPRITHTSRRTLILNDEDRNGEIGLDLGGEVPEHSIWIAINFETGRHTVASPNPVRIRTQGLDLRNLRRNPRGEIDRLVSGRTLLEIMLIRPTVGAWWLTTGDGGEKDLDGASNGSLQAALSQLIPLAGSPQPPETLRPGDLLLIIDPFQMESFTFEVPR